MTSCLVPRDFGWHGGEIHFVDEAEIDDVDRDLGVVATLQRAQDVLFGDCGHRDFLGGGLLPVYLLKIFTTEDTGVHGVNASFMMSEEAKKRIQIALALAMVVAGARAGYILYQRHEDYVAAQKQQAAKKAGYSNAGLLCDAKETLSVRFEVGEAVDAAAGVGEGRISIYLLSV